MIEQQAPATAPIRTSPFSDRPIRHGSPTELSLATLVVMIRNRWRLVIGLPFAIAVATGIMLLIPPRTYSAGASFVPRGPDGARSALSGLVGQIGLTGVLPSSGESPDFYADLVT